MDNYFDFDQEVDSILESILDNILEDIDVTALEAAKHTIDPKTRDALPDKAFGVVYTSKTEKDKDGNPKRYRKYPLIVKNDKAATKKLVSKALTFFNYCKPEYKKDLANKIVAVVKSENLEVTVSRNNAFLKYVNETQLPKNIKVIDVKKTAKK